jgi:phosphate transport system substrate-binding protein
MRRVTSAVVAGALGMACFFGAGAVRGEDKAKDANKIVVDGSTTVGPIAKAFAEFYMKQNPGVNITVSESGSGNGAKSLVSSTCDVASMSRFMKDDEFKAAVERGVFPVCHTIAVDGIAVIVHRANPVKGLTIAQIRDIYTGKITNWNEVGGPNAKIVVISRDSSSGTYETFESLVMNKEKMASSVEYVNSNGAMRQRVQSTQGAVGYVGLGFADKTVKALEVNKIVPTRATISSGRYPIARPLFMFTNGYPAMGSHLYNLVNLFLSKKGQEMIEAIGFVPLTEY